MFINYSNGKNKSRTVYIFLVRTSSFFSRVISFFTRTNYTHASIGFDAQCRSLYSFARLQTSRPIPAGFVRESRDEGLLSLNPNAPCAVFKLRVTERSYNIIRSRLHAMYYNKAKYTYNYLGPVCCFFRIPLKIPNHYFCSQFVAEILSQSNSITLSKPASLYHPRDIEMIPELELIFKGKLSDLDLEKTFTVV